MLHREVVLTRFANKFMILPLPKLAHLLVQYQPYILIGKMLIGCLPLPVNPASRPLGLGKVVLQEVMT